MYGKLEGMSENQQIFFGEAGAKGPGGRRLRWDAVLILKALVLQRIYNLSDEQMEYQSRDRLSFHRFLGLGMGERLPDSRTLWAYREKLVQAGAAERMFQNFHERLLARGLITKTGTLVDATFVTVPRQRNTREKNASIKAGATAEDWKDQPDKLRQKDLDARWTLKNHVATYGYKNHVKVDATRKLIVAQKVTPANANDGRQLADLMRADDKTVFADCAYQTPSNRALLKQLDI
jgi:transposase, IS5 family